MGEKFRKFLLLMWKNWKLQYRRPVQTIIELLNPVIFTAILVGIRSGVNPEKLPSKIYAPFYPFPSAFFPENLNNLTENPVLAHLMSSLTLVYSPSPNKVLDRSFGMLKQQFKQIIGYQNATMLETHFLTEINSSTLAGIQFNDNLYGKDTIPKDIEVTLRYPP